MDSPSVPDLIGLAAATSLLAGWRLYLAVLAAGLGIRMGVVPLPEHLAALQVLANPWIIALAALGSAAEFFADKVPWLDSLWDLAHTALRPIGGALIALAVVDPARPEWQVAAVLLGGSGALLAHLGKAGSRAAVNLSPEPVSNVIASGVEDSVTTGVLFVAWHYPTTAAAFAAILVGLAVAMILAARKVFRRLIFRREVGEGREQG